VRTNLAIEIVTAARRSACAELATIGFGLLSRPCYRAARARRKLASRLSIILPQRWRAQAGPVLLAHPCYLGLARARGAATRLSAIRGIDYKMPAFFRIYVAADFTECRCARSCSAARIPA
jgi:hypothetical protein